MATPDFGRSVNPISTRGTDYAHYWHPRISRPSDGPACRQLAGLMGLVNVNVGVVLLVYEMNYYVQADWVEIKKILLPGPGH